MMTERAIELVGAGMPECIYRFVVIPAKAGIQAGVAGVLNPPLAFKSRGAT